MLLKWSRVTFIWLVQMVIFIIAILRSVQALCMQSVGHSLTVSTALVSTSNNINTQCIGNIVTYSHTQFYTFQYLSPSILKIKVNSADNILSFPNLNKKKLYIFLGDTSPHFFFFKDPYNVIDLLSLHMFACLRCFYFALREITKFESRMTFVGILSIPNFMKSR
jgi:hypothetical protein